MEANSFPRLTVKYLPISELSPFPQNARTHSNRQLRQIANSIRRFGWTNPVIIDGSRRVIAGHGRVKAAALIGLTEVPTIQIENLTDDELRAYVLADNVIAQKAGWDNATLAIELQYLTSLDIDVTITGFEIAEIDQIIEQANLPIGEEEESPDVVSEAPAITESGDMWFLGKHKVICSNSLHDSTFRTLMGKARASVVFVDPPYNVKIDGHATGNGKTHHREFLMASGTMTEAEYVTFLNDALDLLSRYSMNNSIHYVCEDWRHMGELLSAGRQNYDELANLCIWVKDNGGLGSFYRSQHELIFVFRKGTGPFRNNVFLGKYGRNRTNIWRYPGVSTMSRQSDENNLFKLHPTIKPVAMVADALLDSSARGEIVLDSFLGSGTTLMAAERVGRICYGVEIDPLYVDVAIRRWQKYTGENALHAATNRSFDEIATAGRGNHVEG